MKLRGIDFVVDVQVETISFEDKCCSRCKHSLWDGSYVDLIPSVHLCNNKQSKYYMQYLAWSTVNPCFELKNKDE